MDREPCAIWDEEYRRGRYLNEPPVEFVKDILDAVVCTDTAPRGLYIGCGNGRNYLPLIDAGVDLVGLDISHAAINQLHSRKPEIASRLICGDLDALPHDAVYPVVIGLQVFQHGSRDETHLHIDSAKERVADRGLFCIRVNAVGTDIEYDYELVEEDDDGGFTIRYLDGPKTGSLIHFFAEQELHALFSGWHEVLPLRLHRTWREPRHKGSWLQWEAIWQR